MASSASGAPPAPTLAGTWAGTLMVGRVPQQGVAAATLSQAGTIVSGTLTLTASDLSGTVGVTGVLRQGQARLGGVLGVQRFRWQGRWLSHRRVWRGALVLRGGGHRTRRALELVRANGGPVPQCGADYFASDVMPRVLQPICSQCHVPGGLAQATRLRVAVDDPLATAASAFGLVDAADPLQSLLLQKPRGTVAHGGGVRLPAGSVEDQTLQHWVELVTALGCGAPGGGGGGTGNLFTDNCASCHGADATGLLNAPNVRCATRVADAVHTGRGTAMPSFALADADVAWLETYLTTLCDQNGRTGADLWNGNCATCHGADGRGGRNALGIAGPDVRCNRAVHDPVRAGNGDMPAFPGLSDADIARVQSHLVSLCPVGTATGGDLFAGNCATCHGGDAGGLGSAPSVRCATRVADAVLVGRGSRMPGVPALAGADMTALTGFLSQLCALNGRTGADFYAGNCSSCHGATASGGRNGLGVRGPGIQCTGIGDYREKVRFGEDGMPPFPALGTSDVDAIVSFVHGTFCSGG